MANEEHLSILRQGVYVWNRWRKDNPELRPDLSEADLHGMNLSNADLRLALLSRADLSFSFLSCVSLNRADLRLAFLTQADFGGGTHDDWLHDDRWRRSDLKSGHPPT